MLVVAPLRVEETYESFFRKDIGCLGMEWRGKVQAWLDGQDRKNTVME